MAKVFATLDKSDLKKFSKTPEGFLRLDEVFITRTGVFSYIQPDGKVVRQLRHPDEVFKPESLASAKALVVTDEHPEVDGKRVLIDANNAPKFTRGHLVDEPVVIDKRFVKTGAMITDASLIDRIESREQLEVSCGYSCEHDNTPGIFEGEPYDLIQRNITYNHLAVTKSGRAGREVAIKLDSNDIAEISSEVVPMEKIMIDGVEFECTPELKKVLEAKFAKHSEKEGQMQSEQDKLQAKTDSLEAVKESLENEVKTLKEKVTTDSSVEVLDARVNERLTLIEKAKRFVADSIEFKGLSNREVKLKAITAAFPNRDLSEKSEDYVNASFDALDDLGESAIKQIEDGFNKNNKEITDGEDDLTLEQIKAKARQESVELGRKPLN